MSNVLSDFQRRMVSVLSQNGFIAAVARKDARVIGADFYNYGITVSAVASGATAQGTVTVQADSDFVISYMSGVQYVNNSAVGSPYTTVQVTDTGTGRAFFNAQTPMGLVFGAGGFPFLLPAPRVFPPNTTILLELTNVNSAAAATYYFNFIGTRIYYANK